MRPTEHLARCPYIMEVMAELGGVWGRSRLMGLGAGAEVPEHVDAHYHWRTHLRIHVPVITNPQVEFTCGGETVHMAPGECWLFDSFRWHEVQNRGNERRVHLVLDTVVTEHLWDVIDAAQTGIANEPKFVGPGGRPFQPLLFEQVNAPAVMSPWEVRCHLAFIAEQAAPHVRLPVIVKRLDRFADGWAALWAQFGTADAGVPHYIRLISAVRSELQALGGGELTMTNEIGLTDMLDQLIFVMAVAQQPVLPSLTPGQRLAS